MFDLSAYLQRIQLPARVTADAEGLGRLQRAHRLAIPFENLDVTLGRRIAIDGGAVFDKLVTGRRGGFCFEHDRLFGDALAALGFTARPLLARVWLGTDQPPPLTHVLRLVTIAGQDWIADPGFGGSYAPVMPLTDGAAVTATDGARVRLHHDATFGWMVSRDGHPGSTDGRGGGAGWQAQYSFTTAEVYPADLAMGAHWAATAPSSRFVRHAVVSLVLPHGFASLTDRQYRRRASSEDTAGVITDPRVYRMRLSMMFGIDLTREEVAGLGLFDAPQVTH